MIEPRGLFLHGIKSFDPFELKNREIILTRYEKLIDRVMYRDKVES